MASNSKNLAELLNTETTISTGDISTSANLDITGGTVRLDGNHPVGTGNVALGNTALDSNVSGGSNTAIGADALTDNTASNNTAVGYQAGYSNQTGTLNTFIGRLAGYSNTASKNTFIGNGNGYTTSSGQENTSVGDRAFWLNTTGNNNESFGAGSLENNTTGSNNVAYGSYSLKSNTTASYNTAAGGKALYSNTTAQFNAAFGYEALRDNTTGADNTALGGYQTLIVNTTGSYNTAVGRAAMQANTTGSYNTAVGHSASHNNSTGAHSAAFGRTAGYSRTTANYQVAIGNEALYNATTGDSNTAVGHAAGSQITTGYKNTILGRYNGNQGGLNITTAHNHIVLSDGDGNPRFYIDENGKTFIGGDPNGGTGGTDTCVISNTASGQQVIFQYRTQPYNWGMGVTSGNAFSWSDGGGTQKMFINSSGQAYNQSGTWGTISDEKVKENIVDASPKLDDLLRLQVRNFNLIEDKNKTKLLGFVAQEIEQIFPGMVEDTEDHDEHGNDLGTVTKTVKTTVLVPMLVKALQELSAKNDALEARIAALEAN